jgi:type II secretory pathway component PulF
MTTIAPPPQPKAAVGAPIYYLIYLALVLFPVSTCLIFTLKVAPTFKDVFKDFKTELPPLTQSALGAADLVCSGGWIVILLVALVLPIWPARWTARQPSRMTRFNQLFLAFNIVFLANLTGAWLAAYSLSLPLIKLVRSISGGDPGAE